MTTANTDENVTVKPEDVAGAASVVARYLQTRYVSKKHGGYDIYEDDRLAIWLDTYVPNISIRLLMNGEKVMVFSASYHSYRRPSIFHPGAWCDYLLGPLLTQAREARARLEAKQQARRDAETVARYAPIADAHLFNREGC